MSILYDLKWSKKELTRQKLGTFCEYYAKMVLASYGMNIFTSEIDDHGIDFVAETSKGFLKFQVKAIRQGTNYVYMRKKYFDISDNSLYLLFMILVDDEHPKMYMIPSNTWDQNKGKIFVSRNYANPEYGINISKKNMPFLENYKLENMLSSIL